MEIVNRHNCLSLSLFLPSNYTEVYVCVYFLASPVPERVRTIISVLTNIYIYAMCIRNTIIQSCKAASLGLSIYASESRVSSRARRYLAIHGMRPFSRKHGAETRLCSRRWCSFVLVSARVAHTHTT